MPESPAVTNRLLRSVPVPRKGLQWREFGSDAILLDPASGDYAQINGGGLLVWKQVDGVRTVRQIIDALTQSVDADPDAVAADTCDFLEGLADVGVITLER